MLIQLFTVRGLAQTGLSRTSKAPLLSFFWTGTAPIHCAIWPAEHNISFTGYPSACGLQLVASALQPALLLGGVTG